MRARGLDSCLCQHERGLATARLLRAARSGRFASTPPRRGNALTRRCVAPYICCAGKYRTRSTQNCLFRRGVIS
jgi:hypothetical protein